MLCLFNPACNISWINGSISFHIFESKGNVWTEFNRPSIRNPLYIWDMMKIEKLVDLTDPPSGSLPLKRCFHFKGGMEDGCHCSWLGGTNKGLVTWFTGTLFDIRSRAATRKDKSCWMCLCQFWFQWRFLNLWHSNKEFNKFVWYCFHRNRFRS